MYSCVPADPPRSRVMCLPSAMVCSVSASFRFLARRVMSPCTHRERGFLDFIGVLVQAHVPGAQSALMPLETPDKESEPNSPQHHQRREQEGGRVGQSFTGDVGSTTVDGLEDRSVFTDVSRGRQTETTNQASGQV